MAMLLLGRPGTPTTSVFTNTDAATGFFGFFDSVTNPARRVWWFMDSTWTGYVNGSDCTMNAGGGSSTPFWVSIDDGAYAQKTVTAGVMPVFTGLPDTQHLVRIRCDSAVTNGSAWTFTSGAFLSVTGLIPALSFTPWGSKYMVTDPAFPGQFMGVKTATPGGNVTPTFANTGRGSIGGYGWGSSIRIRAKCSDIWVYTADERGVLFIDGVTQSPTNPVPITMSGFAAWKKFATGLDSGTFHDYVVVTGFAGVNNAPPLGIAISGTGTAFTTLTNTKTAIQYGDSVSYATNYPDQATCEGDFYNSAAHLNVLGVPAAVSGLQTATLAADLASVFALRPAVENIAVMAMGRNDISGDRPTFRANYTSCINQLLTRGVPKIVCRGININNNASAEFINLDADIATVVTTIANPNVVFVPVTSWTGVEGVAPNTPPGDGAHPTKNGNLTLAGYETTAYAPYF